MSFDGSDSEKVLSYGDVVLRKADVNLLSGEFWLNDVGRQGCIKDGVSYLATS